MTTSNWREQFLELASAVRQQLALPAENPVSDPATPAQFAFSLNGVTFDALHLPEGEIGIHQMLLQCRMGGLDPNRNSDLLQMALQANQALARTRSGVLGLDPATQELVIGMKQSLQGLNANDLCEGATLLASLVAQWRAAHGTYTH